MNRFWGRNEHSVAPKFSRDDEQILALNYENLCDGDYLNRLFVADSTLIFDDSEPKQDNHQENSLFSSDISEDLIIFGDSFSLGKSFFHKRLSRELTAKSYDNATTVVNKQAVVFEHIGKLMMERCIAPIPSVNRTKLDANRLEKSKEVETLERLSFAHLSREMLATTLKFLEVKPCEAIRNVSVESVISVMLQILSNSSKSAITALTDIGPARKESAEEKLTPSLIASLRSIFSKGLLRCMAISSAALANTSSQNCRAINDSLRLSLTCFFGLLSLGLYTRDPADVLLALTQLMAILHCAEEWQESFRNEIKAQLANGPTASVASLPGFLSEKAAVVTKPSHAIKSKPVVVESVKPSPNKIPSKDKSVVSSGHSQQQVDDVLKGVGVDDRVERSNVPRPQLPIASGVQPASSSGSQMVVVPLTTQQLATTPSAPSIADSGRSLSGVTSKPVIRTAPLEKELQRSMLQQVKSGKPADTNGKMSAIEMEILSSMLPPSSTTVNYVTLNNNNNNNREQPLVSTRISINAGTTDGAQRAGKVSPVLRNLHAEAEQLRRSVREFKESLGALLHVPKPTASLLFDQCHALTSTPVHSSAASTDTKSKPAVAAVSVPAESVSSKPSNCRSSYVWASGQNSYGELGAGDIIIRKSFTRVSALDDKHIVSIGAGNEHSLFVSRDGKLYSAGYNDNGQCGTGNIAAVRNPSVVTLLEGEDIAQVHVYNGCEHTLAVTKDGKLFAFGYNYRGQLGLGNTASESTPRPVRTLLSRKIVLAACSYHHSVMLCSSGVVYSCGRNDSGQLGHGDTNDKKTPQAVPNCPRDINSISCGQFHTIASTTAGVAYACGKNDYGQLGIESTSNVKILSKITNLPIEIDSIVQVCCGYYHTMILASSGVVAGFGRNDYGQLGLGHAQPKVYQSTVIGGLRDKGVTVVSAGCYHSVVVTGNGMLYVFGRNNHGQLATGDQEERHSPHPVDDFVGQRIISVAAGFYHTIVLTSDATGARSSDDALVSPRLLRVKTPYCAGNDENVVSEGKELWRSFLLKDASELTGISAPSRKKMLDFSSEQLSRTTCRELLLFLMNHVERLVDVPSLDHAAAAEAFAPSKTSKVSSAPVGSNHVCSVLSSVITLMEVWRRVAVDHSGLGMVVVPHDDLFSFMQRLLRVVSTYIKENKAVIMSSIEGCRRAKMVVPESAVLSLKDIFTRQYLSQCTKLTEVIRDVQQMCGVASEDGSADTNACDAAVVRCVLLLRRELLCTYFSPGLTVEEDRESKQLVLANDISVCLAKHHDVFFSSGDVAELFASLSDSLLHCSATTSTITRSGSNNSSELLAMASQSCAAHQKTYTLRLLAAFCLFFRSSEEVVRLFQRSKFDGLVVCRHVLALYCCFSRQSLEKRGGAMGAINNATQNVDVGRLVASLEHCISNFIKCAMPVVAASSLSTPSVTNSAHEGEARLFRFGCEMVQDVLAEAESIVDFLLTHKPLSEDLLCRVRYGSIMPSILPSILIYTTAFTKFGCFSLDLLPQLRVLVCKLQQVGKVEVLFHSSSKGVSSAAGTSEKKSCVAAPSAMEVGAAVPVAPTVVSEAVDNELLLLDEPHLTRKDTVAQMAWWFRALKLCVALSIKTFSCLIHCSARARDLIETGALLRNEEDEATERSDKVLCELDCHDVTHHSVWKFLSPSSKTTARFASAVQLEEVLLQQIDEKHTSEMVLELCRLCRNKEKSSDLMYKMLSQSSQSLFSANLLNHIEESILEAVLAVTGLGLHAPEAALRCTEYFKLISRVTKHIHSKRSTLLTYSNELSWVEVLLVLCNTFKIVCGLLVDGQIKILLAVPLPVRRTARPALRAFRSAVAAIVCLSRWKTCVHLRMKSVAAEVVDFVFAVCGKVTDGFGCVSTDKLAPNILSVLEAVSAEDVAMRRYCLGVAAMQSLVADVGSIAMKCDVLSVLAAALRDRADSQMELGNRLGSKDTAVQSHRQHNVVCCSQTALAEQRRTHNSLANYVMQLVSAAGNSNNFSHQELQLIAQSLKLLQVLELIVSSGFASGSCASRSSSVPLAALQHVLVTLNDKQRAATNVNVDSSSSGGNDKAAKKVLNQRERSGAFRKASLAIVSYMQGAVFLDCKAGIQCRPNLCCDFLRTLNALLTYYQLQRIAALRLELQEEESMRQHTNGGTPVEGKELVAAAKGKETLSKKRYQDLILKPTEFCRNVDGFVVPGDKLLNCYKGVDFTLSTWVLLTKPVNSKYCFIAGRISHNDVWPLVLLRADGKLEISYGQNNEFDKLTTECAVALNVWTHIAVVVEAKKIKVFVNGVQDCHVNTAKGNGRAVLFPLIIGSCPLSVRSRVAHIREGLDGMLSQFRYYSRALSPIHVKAIHDAGPPETTDLSERVCYQLLAAMKCVLRGDVLSIHCASEVRVSADLLHEMFVTTESSRRVRFASLDLLSSILQQNVLFDLTLASKVLSAASFAPSPVKVMDSSFLAGGNTFHERMALYLVRLVGAAWAPHLYFHVEDSNAPDEDITEFLKHTPALLVKDSGSNQLSPFSALASQHSASSLGSSTMVDKLVSSETTRGEIANQAVKTLCALADSSSEWSDAVVNVLKRALRTGAEVFQAQGEMSSTQKVDLFGAVLLVSGGTTGPFLGASVSSFFGDVPGAVLNINKTSNTATLLTANATRTVRQITKVRLCDLKVDEMLDKLPVGSEAMQQLLPVVLETLDALSDYIALLLSDMFSTFRPDHILQSKSLLRCMRPVEIFVYSQLLQSTSLLHSDAFVSELEQRAGLYSVLQQASVATLRLEDYEDELITDIPSISHIWNRCANYLLALPTKLVRQNIYVTGSDVKIVYDFIQKHLGVSIDSVIDTPYEKLLTQGRLSELIQYISVDTGTANMDELLQGTRHGAVEGQFSGLSLSTPDRQYLISDWASAPSLYAQWPSLISSSGGINEQDYINILRMLYLLRRNIVMSSRSFLSGLSRFHAASLESKNVSSNMLLWQATLPLHSRSYLLEIDARNEFFRLVQQKESTWRAISEYLCSHDRDDVTQSIAYTLRYSISVLQDSLGGSETNILITSDIFRRSLQTMHYWLEFVDRRPDPEDVFYQVLKVLLSKLSHVSHEEVQVQLVTICVTAVRKLCVRVFAGYRPRAELMELIKGHNFALLRAMAQVQVIMHKSHNLSNVSPLAFVLTQLVTGLELVQRQGSILEFEALQAEAYANSFNGAATKQQYNTLVTAKIQLTETAPPKVLGTRSISVDIDLSACAQTSTVLLRHVQEADADASASNSSKVNAHQWQNVTVEVAIGSGAASGEVHFETVYCGTSLRLSQSDLMPDCSYVVKCRAFFGAIPLTWSVPVEFRTEKGTLFTFDRMKCGADISLSSDGLAAVYQGDDTWSTLLGTKSFSSGVSSWEIRVTKSSTQYIFVGVATSAVDLNTFLGGCGNGWGFIGEQALYHNREKVKIYGDTFDTGDVIGVTLDLNHGTLSFSKNHKSLGVAFDKIFGELYPAVAFYNMDQQLEILPGGFRTTCPCEPIPVSPSRLSIDDISLLNELVLSIYYRHPLSHRLLVLVAEHCNQWSTSSYVRCRAVSGKDVFIATDSPLLKRFGLVATDRVRTPYGVAEVVGAAFNKVWFKVNAQGEVWFFSNQQITEGRTKKLFLRCSYDLADGGAIPRNKSSDSLASAAVYDAATIQDLVDPSKWSEEMDLLLMTFLAAQAESVPKLDPATNSAGTSSGASMWKVSSAQVADNFRTLQQQLSRLMLSCDDLSHRWGIAGPKRKAVLARLGLLRLLNQMLDMYLPFLIADTASNAFVQDLAPSADSFNPMILSLDQEAPFSVIPHDIASNKHAFISVFWDRAELRKDVMHVGPLHAIRRRIFPQLKLAHFAEVVAKSATRPSKTEDDYDYPDDLPHVKINRMRSFRAREAAELMLIPGEDLLLSSMFCQMWRELRQHTATKLRISYTHPMDDGQSRTFKIKFDGEGVDDYGGPYREIFQQICEELQRPDPSAGGVDRRPSSWAHGEDKQTVNPQFPDNQQPPAPNTLNDKSAATRCFLPLLLPTANWTAEMDCKERYRYTFHPSSTSPLRMDLYHFLGQLVGIAVRSKITLDLSFPSLIWKCVVGERLTDSDLASIDVTAHHFVQRLGAIHKQLKSTDAELVSKVDTADGATTRESLVATANELLVDVMWTATRSDGRVVELCKDGAQTPVLVEDIGSYLTSYVEARLSESKDAIDLFTAGLVSIIPESVLSLLTWEEVQTAVCGTRVIDIQRLRENTEYDDDLSPDDAHILHFWAVLTEFSEEEKSTFLKFVWARPTLPPRGVDFSQKMRVLSAVGEDAHLKPDQYLPKAHTCFFSINLPKYTTKKLMAEKLRYAIFNCTEMDADFKTTDVDVAGWNASSSAQTGGDWL